MSCPGSTLGDAYAAGWAQRVIDNGGARPAQTTVDAAATFYNALVTANILSKMKVINIVAPDSLIAARTPFIRKYGSDPWTDVSATPYAAGNLNVNGLINTGGWANALNTGIVPSTAWPSYTNAGVTVYEVTDPGAGAAYGHTGVNDGTWQFALYANAGSTIGDCGPGGAGFAQAAQTIPGYYSCSRTASDKAYLYFATPAAPHSAIGSNLVNVAGGEPGQVLYAMAFRIGGATQYSTAARISFFGYHEGLSAAESSAFYNAIQRLRMDLGGGFVVDTDDAESVAINWAARVVTNGGAMPSAATISAAEDFYQDLIDAGIHTKIKVMNFIAPDSLIAALTPLKLQAGGLDPWTNTGFVAGDLTVNGLKGNGSSKYLNTGVVPSAVMTNTSGGLTIYQSENVNSVTAQESLGCYGAALQSWLAISARYRDADTNGYFGCWKYTTANTDYVTWAVKAGVNGFYSGSRTAANAIAAYFANGTNPFAVAASGSGVSGGTTIGTYSLYAFASNQVGTTAFYSPNRYSFFAMHDGLNATETEDLYDAVQALRTALGGGFV